MRHKSSSSKVAQFFRKSLFVLAVLVVSGGVVFLVRRGNADSVPGFTAFQAADMGSRAVIEEMKNLSEGDAITRLNGICEDGIISGKNSSGEYQVVFRDSSDQPMGCSESLGDVASIETTGIFGTEKRIVRSVLAQSTPAVDSNVYVTTGSESQYKKGALGIGGLLKAYSGINASGNRVTNVAAPASSSDVATKGYVDAAGGGGSCSGGVSGGCTGSFGSLTGGSIQSVWGKGCKAVYASAVNCSGAADASYECGEVYSTDDIQGSASYRTFYCLCAPR
ncbi:MAG: hypothetical protein IPJ67_00460 [Candidatus Moraniibacteriota bacterium]|nr:MAG: hypothetical protein IPJ67_00460 [Candidatus Moranbacteria bacterium]